MIFDLRELVDEIIAIVRSLPRAGTIAVSADVGLMSRRIYPEIPAGSPRFAQFPWQRDKIHTRRKRSTGRDAHGPAGSRGSAAICRHRHRNRDFGRRACEAVQAVRTRRHGRCAPVRRHRAWPGDQQAGRGDAWRLISAESAAVELASTFSCDIPFGRPTRPTCRHRAPAIERKRPDHSLRILVAEDTPANQLVIEAILEKLGHRVRSAANGVEALALARKRGYRSDLDGHADAGHGRLPSATLIRRIDGPRAGCPSSALTAFAQPADRERALSAGMNDYLRKPIRKTDVEGLLGRLFAGRILRCGRRRGRYRQGPRRPAPVCGRLKNSRSLSADRLSDLDALAHRHN